ncbi:glycosyltransferase family 39 protein [Halosimplex marinum]|uniref:glycosyltransferase family 39 protein n=1 Tax=Halosimplex marinum TaxID=3396620 RepID=UPI003F567E18
MGVTDPVRSALPDGVAERVDDLESVGLVGAVLVVALVVRVRALTSESLWMDEVYSITYATERSTLEILTELPLEDPHPPLYYLLLRGWTAVFGASKVATRSMSLVFGVAAVALLFALGRRLYDRETATIGAAMLALSGMHLYFSQDTRMYSLYTALSVASLYWYVRVVFDGDRSRRTLAGYVATTVLLGYTHVFGLFLVLAQNCYLLVHVLRIEWSAAVDLLRRWVGLQAVTALLLGPFLAVLGMRLLGYPPFDSASPTWIPSPSRACSSTLSPATSGTAGCGTRGRWGSSPPRSRSPAGRWSATPTPRTPRDGSTDCSRRGGRRSCFSSSSCRSSCRSPSR